MNISRKNLFLSAALALAASLSGCVAYGPPQDAPAYEPYGYPDNYGGPGYYGSGYYQPGYYGGYWYGGGYYAAPSGGYYAPYPYYPGTHVIIVDHDHPRPPPPGNPPVNGDPRKIIKSPHDPVNPQPRGDQPRTPAGPPGGTHYPGGARPATPTQMPRPNGPTTSPTRPGTAQGQRPATPSPDRGGSHQRER